MRSSIVLSFLHVSLKQLDFSVKIETYNRITVKKPFLICCRGTLETWINNFPEFFKIFKHRKTASFLNFVMFWRMSRGTIIADLQKVQYPTTDPSPLEALRRHHFVRIIPHFNREIVNFFSLNRDCQAEPSPLEKSRLYVLQGDTTSIR